MKKIFAIMMVVLLILTAAVNVSATDAVDEPMTEAVTEAAETTTEAQEEATKEVETEPDTEAETSLVEIDSELGVLLNGATPEQIENIKQYILYGISTLPLPDRVRAFASEYLNAIAWIVAGVTFLLFFVGNRMTKKSLSDSITTNNNNMVEAYDKAKKIVEDAEKSMVKVERSVYKALAVSDAKSDAALKEARDYTDKALEAMTVKGNELLGRAKDSTDAALKAMTELKEREAGLTEAEIMLATIIHDLVQNSNLPEWKKDEFTAHLNEGLAKIKEVTEHDEA